MQDCGLGSADFNAYMQRCALPHEVEVHVDLLNNEGDLILSFDEGRAGDRGVVVTDGSVSVDATTLVGRVLSLTVSDPNRLLVVAEDANFTDRMLSVSVGVHVPELGRIVWAPVFRGPIVSAPRAGDVIQFTAQGKARFAQHGIRDIYTIPKGTKKTDAIRRILNQLAGEYVAAMGDIPDLAPVLSDDLVIAKGGTDSGGRPWAVCRSLADSMNRHLCYDGAGFVRMQRTDLDNPVYTFTEGATAPGLVTAIPEVSTDWSGIKNAVQVTGGATSTQQAPVAFAFADPSNPFSAQTLGRNGAPAYFWDFVTIDTVHSQSVAQNIADNTLARDLRVNTTYKFESMPIYVFDELDLVAIQTPDLVAHTRLSQFTIPLNIDGGQTMTFGWNGRRNTDVFAKRR